MADILKLQDEVARDEQGLTETIYQKDGDPYLAPDGSECTITILGMDAKRVRRTQDSIQRRLVQKHGRKFEPAEYRKQRIELAASAVTGWAGWTAGEQPLEYSNENTIALLSVEHILEQVEAILKGHAAFFKSASSK